MLEPHAPAQVEKAIRPALRGDRAMLRELLARLVSVLRAADHRLDESLALTGHDLAEQGRGVVAALAAGQLSPETAGQIMAVLGGLAGIHEVADLVTRLEHVEGFVKRWEDAQQ
jgi:hypothetical protein